MPTLIIMRGLPGAGKTTEIRRTFGRYMTVCSADNWFERAGSYVFVPHEIGRAHEGMESNP